MKLLPGVEGEATFSPCLDYRYLLTREWDRSKPRAVWIMLNPSTASADEDDPTVRRTQTFSLAWGFGGVVVLNLFALRSTDPKALYAHPSPIGPENDAAMEAVVSESRTGIVVAAWGVHGAHLGRGDQVRDLVNALLSVLGLTKAGHPRHPLYVAGSTAADIWQRASERKTT